MNESKNNANVYKQKLMYSYNEYSAISWKTLIVIVCWMKVYANDLISYDTIYMKFLENYKFTTMFKINEFYKM